jgi:hypothetical protein
MSKVLGSAAEAVADMAEGASIAIAGPRQPRQPRQPRAARRSHPGGGGRGISAEIMASAEDPGSHRAPKFPFRP